jgi:hypothetical protein
MHVCAPGLSRHLLWAAVAGFACGKGTPPSPPSSPEPLESEPTLTSAATADPCGTRARCALEARQPVEDLPGAELVRLLLARAPDATTDAEQCDRREYWLVRETRITLLTADCAAQYGADTQGPAEIEANGIRLSVRYVEFQESDRCEHLDATINLSNLQVERQERRLGSVSHDTCAPDGPQPLVTPPGDGSVDRPLLLLHRG